MIDALKSATHQADHLIDRAAADGAELILKAIRTATAPFNTRRHTLTITSIGLKIQTPDKEVKWAYECHRRGVFITLKDIDDELDYLQTNHKQIWRHLDGANI